VGAGRALIAGRLAPFAIDIARCIDGMTSPRRRLRNTLAVVALGASMLPPFFWNGFPAVGTSA
jgi:hypothetical protein